MKVKEAAKPDFRSLHTMSSAQSSCPRCARLAGQEREVGVWPGKWGRERRGPVPAEPRQERDSKKSKTGDSRKTGNSNKNTKLISCRSTQEVWKRRFSGEEGQTEVSMAAEQYNLASLVRAWWAASRLKPLEPGKSRIQEKPKICITSQNGKCPGYNKILNSAKGKGASSLFSEETGTDMQLRSLLKKSIVLIWNEEQKMPTQKLP